MYEEYGIRSLSNFINELDIERIAHLGDHSRCSSANAVLRLHEQRFGARASFLRDACYRFEAILLTACRRRGAAKSRKRRIFSGICPRKT